MGVVFSTAGAPYYRPDASASAATTKGTKLAESELYSKLMGWPGKSVNVAEIVRNMIEALVNETHAVMQEYPGSPAKLVRLAAYGKWHQTILPSAPELENGAYDLLTAAVDSVVSFYMSARQMGLAHPLAVGEVMRVVARVQADIAKELCGAA